ncbi:hypothetical protein ECAE60S_01494 [Eoetvoesiella caeni]
MAFMHLLTIVNKLVGFKVFLTIIMRSHLWFMVVLITSRINQFVSVQPSAR